MGHVTRARGGLQTQCIPALHAQVLQGLHILLKNRIGLWKGLDRPVDTVFAQKMQDGKRRAVGVIGDVVGVRTGKLKLRMKAGNLEDTVKLHAAQQPVALGQEIVEVQKIREGQRRYQKCSVPGSRFLGLQPIELIFESFQQIRMGAGGGDHIMDLTLNVHALGEGAQVQANDRTLQPRDR